MKNLSLILAVALLFIQALASPDDLATMTLRNSATLTSATRLSYMLIHANWLHLVINLYTFLSLVFVCNARTIHFLIAITIAALIPNALLSATPMCGMSVLNYALTGLIISRSSKWLWLFSVNMIIVAAGSWFAGIAVLAHIWGLVIGFALSFIFSKPVFDE